VLFFLDAKKKNSISQPRYFYMVLIVDQFVFAFDNGRLRDFHDNQDGISRFFFDLSSSQTTEQPVRKLTQEHEDASLADESNINGKRS